MNQSGTVDEDNFQNYSSDSSSIPSSFSDYDAAFPEELFCLHHSSFSNGLNSNYGTKKTSIINENSACVHHDSCTSIADGLFDKEISYCSSNVTAVPILQTFGVNVNEMAVCEIQKLHSTFEAKKMDGTPIVTSMTLSNLNMGMTQSHNGNVDKCFFKQNDTFQPDKNTIFSCTSFVKGITEQLHFSQASIIPNCSKEADNDELCRCNSSVCTIVSNMGIPLTHGLLTDSSLSETNATKDLRLCEELINSQHCFSVNNSSKDFYFYKSQNEEFNKSILMTPSSEYSEVLSLRSPTDSFSISKASPDSGILSNIGSPSGNESPCFMGSTSTVESNHFHQSSISGTHFSLTEKKKNQCDKADEGKPFTKNSHSMWHTMCTNTFDNDPIVRCHCKSGEKCGAESGNNKIEELCKELPLTIKEYASKYLDIATFCRAMSSSRTIHQPVITCAKQMLSYKHGSLNKELYSSTWKTDVLPTASVGYCSAVSELKIDSSFGTNGGSTNVNTPCDSIFISEGDHFDKIHKKLYSSMDQSVSFSQLANNNEKKHQFVGMDDCSTCLNYFNYNDSLMVNVSMKCSPDCTVQNRYCSSSLSILECDKLHLNVRTCSTVTAVLDGKLNSTSFVCSCVIKDNLAGKLLTSCSNILCNNAMSSSLVCHMLDGKAELIVSNKCSVLDMPCKDVGKDIKPFPDALPSCSVEEEYMCTESLEHGDIHDLKLVPLKSSRKSFESSNSMLLKFSTNNQMFNFSENYTPRCSVMVVKIESSKTPIDVKNGEFASLIQSVHNSIQSQFSGREECKDNASLANSIPAVNIFPSKGLHVSCNIKSELEDNDSLEYCHRNTVNHNKYQNSNSLTTRLPVHCVASDSQMSYKRFDASSMPVITKAAGDMFSLSNFQASCNCNNFIKSIVLKANSHSDVAIANAEVKKKYKRPTLRVMMHNVKHLKRRTVHSLMSQSISAKVGRISAKCSACNMHSVTLSQNMSISSCAQPRETPNRLDGCYRPSNILRKSSFQLNSRLSDVVDPNDESLVYNKKKIIKDSQKMVRKKLMNHKSRQKSKYNSFFQDKIQSLWNHFKMMHISQDTFIKVKSGEVLLPSIFRLAVIHVKKNEKTALPMTLNSVKLKKSNKCWQDSRSTDVAPTVSVYNEIVDHTSCSSPDNIPSCVDTQIIRDQYLPPKKRHRMMHAIEGISAGVMFSKTNSHLSSVTDRRQARLRRIYHDSYVEQNYQHLPCPHHAHCMSTADNDMSCTECGDTDDAHSLLLSGKASFTNQTSNKTQHFRRIFGRLNSSKRECGVGSSATICKHDYLLKSSSSLMPQLPKFNNSMVPTKLQDAEIVMNPLPQYVVNIRQCKSSSRDCNVYDCGDDDTAMIKDFHSEFEPLPLEHCLKESVKQFYMDGLSTPRKRRWISVSDDQSTGCTYPLNSSCNIHGQNRNGDNHPPRKSFHRVGLFSIFYKFEKPRKRIECCSRNSLKAPFSHELFPSPIHFGEYLRGTQSHFQLPYDIWWHYDNDLGHGNTALRPKFKQIRCNVYVDVKANRRDYEPQHCNCKVPINPKTYGCLEDCLNRAVFTECTSETCPCGDQCSNRRIQRQEWALSVEMFSTVDCGLGVHTLKPIKCNHIILEYLGEVVSDKEFRRRMTEEYSQDCHHYCLNIDGKTVIDGYRMGNLARFVNHSCEPNCEMQKWNVNGRYHMVLIALRDIEPLEEITYDYNFHSFNIKAQQKCRCGSVACRGVIGGKFQRQNQKQSLNSKLGPGPILSALLRPVSPKERIYVRKQSIFLLRNISRTRGVLQSDHEKHINGDAMEKISNILSMKDSMNENRSVKTRLVALAEENPDLQRRHHFAMIFLQVYNTVAAHRDEAGVITATPLMVLPSRRRHPDYYQAIHDPIDLTTIRGNIQHGHYTDIQHFDDDFVKLFRNVEVYCGKNSRIGHVVDQLRQLYMAARGEAVLHVESLTGKKLAAAFSTSTQTNTDGKSRSHGSAEVDNFEEDVIRCICGVSCDEGYMIQCEKCYIWQHCDCVNVEPSSAKRDDIKYCCELCDPRAVDKEIINRQRIGQNDGPDGEACVRYLTLVCSGLQIAQGDVVYLLRGAKWSTRFMHKQLTSFRPDNMDIFRVEDLFKNSKGDRFMSGHLYLRPHEVYHEPSRKFFHNEVFRYPLFTTFSLERVGGKCVVLDLNTFCKGKPKGFDDADIYVCEFRVDKDARNFSKIGKKFPINTKSFCFEKYQQRLCPKRTYVPHKVPTQYLRRSSSDRHAADCSRMQRKMSTETVDCGRAGNDTTNQPNGSTGNGSVCCKEKDKKIRLNNLLLSLLDSQSASNADKYDVSYLLEHI